MSRAGRLLLAGALGAVFAVLVIAVNSWLAWNRPVTPPRGTPATVEVRVAPGTSLTSVVADLQRRGMLRHGRVLLAVARLSGRDQDLHVGRYLVPAGASPREILDILTSGRPVPLAVTLPEGMEATALALILADSLDLRAGDILAAADSLVMAAAPRLMSEAQREQLAALTRPDARPGGVPLHWCEGYLAPDTYHFAEGTDAVAVARAAVSLQLARLDSLAGTAVGGRTPHELLTLASIVEAEARLAHERARIAAVYVNRLDRGMRLEADPTVAFWLGKRGERLLYRDLEVDSPYNTYRRGGLPPGPIGAPGHACLQAAARPDAASDHIFFVADGDGGHVFSRTADEHRRAVARYREIMRQRRR
jgi:UPF0755 protein